MNTGGIEGAMPSTLPKYTHRTYTHIYKYAYMKTGEKEGGSAKGRAGKHQGMCAF